MATYALTFDTRADFNSALSSGSIASLMSGVTSTNPSVAITAFIKATGETIACGTNVMVDIKSVGPGDMVLYDSNPSSPTYGQFFGIARKWIDNNYPGQPTQAVLIYTAGVLSSYFVECGTVLRRYGNKIRLCAPQSSNPGLPWTSTDTSDYAWNVDALNGYTSIMKKGGKTVPTDPSTGGSANPYDWCAFPSARYQEYYFSSGSTDYLPITRSAWNTAVANLTSPTGTISMTVGSSTVSICPAMYDYSYDKFLEYFYAPKRPGPASSAYHDLDGMENTRKIVAAFVAAGKKTYASTDYAAGYCYNYSVNAPGLGKHKWFLGSLADMGDLRPLTHTLKSPIGWGSSYLWSSVQCSAYYAWYVSNTGRTYYDAKYHDFSVVPLADLELNP